MRESGRTVWTDEGGVTELTAVLTLLVVAVVVVAAVGINVLFVETDDAVGPDTRFTFDYSEQAQALLITHQSGPPVKAGDLLIRGPEVEVRWSEINDRLGPSTLIGRERNTSQISRQNGYGQRVRPRDRIAVVYANRTLNQTVVLSQWNGTEGI